MSSTRGRSNYVISFAFEIASGPCAAAVFSDVELSLALRTTLGEPICQVVVTCDCWE